MQQIGSEEKKFSDFESLPAMETFVAAISVPQKQVLYLSPETINEYIEDLQSKGLAESTLDYCRQCMESLYDNLPDCGLEDRKILDKNNLQGWRKQLFIDYDFSWIPVNNRICAVNGYLTYKERPDLKMSFLLHPKTELCQPMTREEYLRLLYTARMHVNERLYLLIKVLGCTGIVLQDMVKLTVEFLKGENETGKTAVQYDSINMPELLKNELLQYTEKKNIVSGPVFITQSGKALDNSNILKGIRALYKDAEINRNSTRAMEFNMLYYQTFTKLQENMGPLAELAYNELLKQEEDLIGWNDGSLYYGSFQRSFGKIHEKQS